jgi:hypothetical protein
MDKNGQKIGPSAAQDGTEDGTKTAQKRGRRTEAQRTAELTAALPVGITIGRWKGERPKPFYLRAGRDRRVESFASEQDRNDEAEKLAERRERDGLGALEVDMGEWREWRAFRSRCTAPLHELEELWRRREAERKVLLSDATSRFLGTWTGQEPAYDHVQLHLRRLTDAYGALPLADVTGELLQELNERLVNPKTNRPLAAQTKFDHRKNWNLFFEWCVTVARLIGFNPCNAFRLKAPVEQDRAILTARQIFDLLHANLDQPVIGRMAFELFGGLRASSAARLTAEDVRRDIKGVRLPGAAHKSGKAKFRQRHPSVLWAWFDHTDPALWDVTTGVYDERKHDAFVRAKVENPGNVLRSSFITYLLALTNNPGLVARLSQHTSLKMLEIYEGVASEQDAERVMAMTPQAVRLGWERFLKKLPSLPSPRREFILGADATHT